MAELPRRARRAGANDATRRSGGGSRTTSGSTSAVSWTTRDRTGRGSVSTPGSGAPSAAVSAAVEEVLTSVLTSSLTTSP